MTMPNQDETAGRSGPLRTITTAQSIQEALVEEFRRDERVFVMGQDLQKGIDGGTAAMFEEFGPERVRDTPISENAFVGAAVGAAAVGMRPIVTSSACFMWAAMDSLVSQAAKMRYMFGGQVNLPARSPRSLPRKGSSRCVLRFAVSRPRTSTFHTAQHSNRCATRRWPKSSTR